MVFIRRKGFIEKNGDVHYVVICSNFQTSVDGELMPKIMGIMIIKEIHKRNLRFIPEELFYEK